MSMERVFRCLRKRTAHLVLFASLLASVLPVRAQTPNREQAKQAKDARAILDSFDSQKSVPSSRKLCVVYFTPANTPPAKDYEARVQRIVEHVRDFYAREMDYWGLGPKSMRLEYDEKKKLTIHLVQGKKPQNAYHYANSDPIHKEVVPALDASGINASKATILLFTNLGKLEGNKIILDSPFYGSGSAKSGLAWVADIHLLDPLNLPKKTPEYKLNGKVSLGGFNTLFMGGTAHELGHGLGLPHNSENAADRKRGTSLMGFGNMTYGEELRGDGLGSFLPLADALRLASHPLFSGTEKQLNEEVKATFRGLGVAERDKAFDVTGKIESSLPCYAVIGFLDPDGGGDYDARTAVAIPDSQGRFTLPCVDLVANKGAEIRLVALFANGDKYQQALPYRVKADGQPDLSDTKVTLDQLQLRQTLKPLIAAIIVQDRKKFDAAQAQVTSGLNAQDRVVVWAKHMAMSFDGKPIRRAPDAVEDSQTDIFLSDCEWANATVGWEKPARNHAPDEGYFLQIGTKWYEKGLYAHASSNYAFNLGNKWTTLKGIAGLGMTEGSVVFVVKGDNKELWRSPVVKAPKPLPFEVKVSGVQRLELIVEDAGDGNSRDVGLWVATKLLR